MTVPLRTAESDAVPSAGHGAPASHGATAAQSFSSSGFQSARISSIYQFSEPKLPAVLRCAVQPATATAANDVLATSSAAATAAAPYSVKTRTLDT